MKIEARLTLSHVNVRREKSGQDTGPLASVIAELCKSCTMLTCCDTAAGCKLRQEIRQRDKECYQRRRPKVLTARKRAYRDDPGLFKGRCAKYRARNRARAVQATRAWRARKRAEAMQ